MLLGLIYYLGTNMIYQILTLFFISFGLIDTTPAENTWKIGVLLCLTGECATNGDNALKGAGIAVQELNDRGGVLGKRIELIVKDTNEAISGARTITVYRELRQNRDVQFILGPTFAPGGLALVPILKKDKNVIITSPSLGAAEFHNSADNIFNAHGTDEPTTRRAADYAFEQGIRRMAIFSSQQAWESQQAKFFEDQFVKLGGQIVVKVEPLPSNYILTTEALKIVSAKPEGVFISLIGQQAIAAKEFRNLGFNKPKFAAIVDEARLFEAEGTLDGTVYFTYQKPTDDFRNKFKNRFELDPEIPSAVGYDVIYAYATAVKQAKTFDVEAVKKEIFKLSFKGASGDIHFDSQGCVEKKISRWKVQDSKLVELN